MASTVADEKSLPHTPPTPLLSELSISTVRTTHDSCGSACKRRNNQTIHLILSQSKIKKRTVCTISIKHWILWLGLLIIRVSRHKSDSLPAWQCPEGPPSRLALKQGNLQFSHCCWVVLSSLWTDDCVYRAAHSVGKRVYLLFQNLQRRAVSPVQWSLEGRKINMSACLKYRQERDWIKADQGPVKQKWGNPHSGFNRVPPAYFSDRRKLNVKLCLTRSLSTVFHRGRKAGSHWMALTTWMCEMMAKQTMKQTLERL